MGGPGSGNFGPRIIKSCDIHGPKTFFSDGRAQCRECQTERMRSWRARNPLKKKRRAS